MTWKQRVNGVPRRSLKAGWPPQQPEPRLAWHCHVWGIVARRTTMSSAPSGPTIRERASTLAVIGRECIGLAVAVVQQGR